MKRKLLFPILAVLLYITSFTGCMEATDTSIFDDPEFEKKILSGNISIDPVTPILGTTLTAIYSGSEAVSFSYQWYKDGAIIENETSESYKPSEIGSYTVSVSNSSYRTKTSSPVSVILATLTGNITILLPDDGINANAVPVGTRLNASYNGDEDVTLLTFQWNKDDEPIQGKTDLFYTPNEVGKYSVTVSLDGYNSKTSESITVVLLSLDGGITIQLPEDVNENNILATTPLTAIYSGEEKVSYQWNKDGSPISSATQKTFTPSEAGSYTVSVILEDYQPKTSSSVTVKTFVPVTNITGVIGKIQIDTPTVINAVVQPANATYKEIEWSISGVAGVDFDDDKLVAPNYGTITLTATIEDGTAYGIDYVQRFEIVVQTYVVLSITMEDSDFGIIDEGQAAFASQSPVVLNSANLSETLTLSDTEIANINWYLGSIPLAVNSDNYTLNYAAFNPGEITLTIFFTKNGKRWSGDFTFTVIKEN